MEDKEVNNKIKEEKVCREQTSDFGLYVSNARTVIRDMYGYDNTKSNVMLDKLGNCKTIAEVNNVLAWGRKNLL